MADKKRSIWELAAEAQAEVEKWPEWKRRVAEQALVSPLPRRPRTRTPMPTHTDVKLVIERAAMSRERTRIVAYLRFMDSEEGYDAAGDIADDLANGDHWDRWDELDDEGQQRPGKAKGAP